MIPWMQWVLLSKGSPLNCWIFKAKVSHNSNFQLGFDPKFILCTEESFLYLLWKPTGEQGL